MQELAFLFNSQVRTLADKWRVASVNRDSQVGRPRSLIIPLFLRSLDLPQRHGTDGNASLLSKRHFQPVVLLRFWRFILLDDPLFSCSAIFELLACYELIRFLRLCDTPVIPARFNDPQKGLDGQLLIDADVIA